MPKTVATQGSMIARSPGCITCCVYLGIAQPMKQKDRRRRKSRGRRRRESRRRTTSRLKMKDKEMVRVVTMLMKKKKEVSHLKAGMSGLAIMIASR